MPGSSRPPSAPWLREEPATERAPETGVRFIADETTTTDVTDQLDARGREANLDRAILTLITGNDAGRVIDLQHATMTIGRSSSADIVIQDGGISRHHARLIPWMGVTIVVEDLESKNGTFVNGKQITRAPLRDGDRLQLGPNVVARYNVVDRDEASLKQQLYRGSKLDPLTQLYNRGHADEQIAREIAHATRHETALSVILLDVDHFKQVNDEHGHPVGDAVLVNVASVLKDSCRTEDLVSRWGGEEFLLVLRSTDRRQAITLAERIRSAVAAASVPLEGGGALSVTVSLGVAGLEEIEGEDLRAQLVAEADRRLYRAKSDGRDRVCGEA